MTLFLLTGCGGVNSPAPTPTPGPTPNEWTWVSGSASVNQAGIYGTQGVAAAGNTPGARVNPCAFTDLSGNFWLFGGYGTGSPAEYGDLNDLWKYSGGMWTWVSGSNHIEQAGTYGTLGGPNASNVPGARFMAACWTDVSGNFWLFGGVGLDSAGTRGSLNDLWKYSGGQWTWTSGSNTVAEVNVAAGEYRPGVYGTQGVPAPDNVPGARDDAATWTDLSGNLWLFGGGGYDSTGAIGILNDLWKYSGGQWTWMSGSNTHNQMGTYGTLGTPAPGNVPGARNNPVTWVDKSGNLWLFGGQGEPASGTPYGAGPYDLNDLWKYSGGQWTWMGGSNVNSQPGVYGTQGTAAPGNIPGARECAVSWTDAAGNFWLFGGFGFDSRSGAYEVYGDLNDLWKYSGGQWTWMSGSNLAGQTGTYGTQGTPAPGNAPGARADTVGWIDGSGNLWLLGGAALNELPDGKFNDLWKYQP